MYLPIKKSINKTLFGCTVGTLLLTGVALADNDPITESFNVSSPLQNLSAMGNFTLPDFDSTLGTLLSVDLTLTIKNTSTIVVFNTGSSPEGFANAMMSGFGTVTGPGGLTLNGSGQSLVASGIAQVGSNTYAPQATTTTSTSSTGSVGSGSLGLWEDQTDGKVDLSYTKVSSTFSGTDLGGDNLLFGGKLSGSGQVSVQYTYLSGTDPVATPEPSAHLLSGLAAGVMAMLLIGRARRQNA